MRGLGILLEEFDHEAHEERYSWQQEIDPALREILDQHFKRDINFIFNVFENARGQFAISLPMFWWWVIGIGCYSGVKYGAEAFFGYHSKDFFDQMIAFPSIILWFFTSTFFVAAFMMLLYGFVKFQGRHIRRKIVRIDRGEEAYQALIASEKNEEYINLLRFIAGFQSSPHIFTLPSVQSKTQSRVG